MSNDSKDNAQSELYKIDPDTYRWTYRTMKTLFKVFKLHIQTHGDESIWLDGDIFLFNHFARFEAFIPQYLIYEKTQLFSRSIASKELFDDNLFGKYLMNLGAIPNDEDSLMYQASMDILQNHKLVVFPEGGIVKDRRSINKKGQYQIYSRSDGQRRKHHTGPAVIALALAIFKRAVRELNQNGKHHVNESWAKELGFKSSDELLIACEKPTTIIPCNITFYPLRIGENALKDSIQFFIKKLPKRLSEELLIEGNLLMKDTDMDIQMGTPIVIEDYWTRLESSITHAFIKNSNLSLSNIFDQVKNNDAWDNVLFRLSYQRNANKIRDDYMHAIYKNVTINIAHIAASFIMHFVNKGRSQINKRTLHQLIYFAIKRLQKDKTLHLHRTIKNPSIYRNLIMTKSETFNQFLRSAYTANLLEPSAGVYHFTEHLRTEHDFDSIRYKNPMAVYANEVAVIPQLTSAIKSSLAFKVDKNIGVFADSLLEDEILEYHWDLAQFQDDKHLEINQQQRIDEESCLPYLLKPKNANGHSVVLIHGLLSTPAELKKLGVKLQNLGYFVIGCRLKGHGTTPWDLHQRTWQDWRQSVRQSIKIAHCHSENVHLVGFSSGSLLALMCASNKHNKIRSVIACSTPVSFKDPLVQFVKIAATANKLIQKFSGYDGFLPFKDNNPEHPHLNYKNIPIASIHQLLVLIDKTKLRLKKLTCPALLIQADNDPVVEPSSMADILNRIGSSSVDYHWISSGRHGILHENTDDCQQKVVDFISKQHN